MNSRIIFSSEFKNYKIFYLAVNSRIIIIPSIFMYLAVNSRNIIIIPSIFDFFKRDSFHENNVVSVYYFMFGFLGGRRSLQLLERSLSKH